MCVSCWPALTSPNGGVWDVRQIVGKPGVSVGNYPFSCVEIVDELWVTPGFSRKAQVRGVKGCG